MASDDFEALTTQARAALDAIAKGDPTGYKALYSRQEDITLGNPFGGFAHGWDEVVEQLERAASHYRDGGTIGFETVSQLVLPELAYTVEIERFNAKVTAVRTVLGDSCTATRIRESRGNRPSR